MPDESENNEQAANEVPRDVKDDIAERPGADQADKQHEDDLVDEWEDESFPAGDPPAHY